MIFDCMSGLADDIKMDEKEYKEIYVQCRRKYQYRVRQQKVKRSGAVSVLLILLAVGIWMITADMNQTVVYATGQNGRVQLKEGEKVELKEEMTPLGRGYSFEIHLGNGDWYEVIEGTENQNAMNIFSNGDTVYWIPDGISPDRIKTEEGTEIQMDKADRSVLRIRVYHEEEAEDILLILGREEQEAFVELTKGQEESFVRSEVSTEKVLETAERKEYGNSEDEPLANLQVIAEKEEIEKIISEKTEIKQYLEQNEPFADFEVITDEAILKNIWSENPSVKELMDQNPEYKAAYVKNNKVNLRKEPSLKAAVKQNISAGDWVILNQKYSVNEKFLWWEAETASGSKGWIANDYRYLIAAENLNESQTEVDFETLKFTYDKDDKEPAAQAISQEIKSGDIEKKKLEDGVYRTYSLGKTFSEGTILKLSASLLSRSVETPLKTVIYFNGSLYKTIDFSEKDQEAVLEESGNYWIIVLDDENNYTDITNEIDYFVPGREENVVYLEQGMVWM